MAVSLGMGDLRVSVRSMLCCVWLNRSMGAKKVAFLNPYGGSLDARGWTAVWTKEIPRLPRGGVD